MFRNFRIDRWEGAVLLVLAVVYTLVNIKLAKLTVTKEIEAEYSGEVSSLTAGPAQSPARITLLILGGLGVLVAGSRAFGIGASDLARMWGVSEALIGADHLLHRYQPSGICVVPARGFPEAGGHRGRQSPRAAAGGSQRRHHGRIGNRRRC